MRKIKYFALVSLLGTMFLSGCIGSEKNILEQADKDLDQNYFQYALDGYLDVVESGEYLPQAYRGAGIAYLRMNHYKDAAEAFSNALRFEKQGKTFYRDVLSYRATAYAHSGKYDEAKADCDLLVSEYPVDANTYFLCGMVDLFMDSYEDAQVNFDHAYEENPTYELALRIYRVYIEKGMEADGTRYLEIALEQPAKTAQDYCDRGRVYYYMADYEHAKEELTTASNAGNGEALLFLGMVYQELGDASNSRSMYQQYLKQVGESARGYNGLAQCDILEGKYQDALDKIARGLEVATTEEMQDLLHNEIVIYERQLDFESALKKAKEFIELFPDDKVIRREIVFLESRTKNAVHYDTPAPETVAEPSEETDNSGSDQAVSAEPVSDGTEEYYSEDESSEY